MQTKKYTAAIRAGIFPILSGVNSSRLEARAGLGCVRTVVTPARMFGAAAGAFSSLQRARMVGWIHGATSCVLALEPYCRPRRWVRGVVVLKGANDCSFVGCGRCGNGFVGVEVTEADPDLGGLPRGRGATRTVSRWSYSFL